MSLSGGKLTFAEHGEVHLSRRYLDDQQAGADAPPLRHIFPGCKQECTRWMGLLKTSTSDHPATPLLVADGAEQAFGDALKTVIAMPSGGSKVIYHQERVLGVECQRLECVRRRR